MTENSRQIKERFLKVFESNKNSIYNYALKMTGDRDSAGDITQEAFVRLYENMDSNSDISSPQNWLFIITRNLCLNSIRNAKKEMSLDSFDNPGSLAYDDIKPDHLKLQKAMMYLEPKYREALILKEYQGFSYDEMSKILGITVSAVRALLYKARTLLKENFEKYNTRGDKNVL